jgi:hypothetical protein
MAAGLRDGYFAGEVRAWSDLARYLDANDLRLVTLEQSLAIARLQVGRQLGGELLHLLERRERQDDAAESYVLAGRYGHRADS